MNEIKKRPKKSMRAFRPHSIIEERLNMSIKENMAFDILLAMVNAESEDMANNMLYTIYVPDYEKLLNYSESKAAYRALGEGLEALYNHSVKLERDEHSGVIFHMVRKVEWNRKARSYTVMLEDETKALLLNEKNGKKSTTYYSCLYSLALPGLYPPRLYYLLKEWEGDNKVRFDNVEELRYKLGYPESRNYGTFKKDLKEWIDKINKLTDIDVVFEEKNGSIGRGNKTTTVSFKVTTKKKKQITKSENNPVIVSMEEIISEHLRGIGLSISPNVVHNMAIKAVENDKDASTVKSRISYIAKHQDSKDNLEGSLLHAMTNKFIDYKQNSSAKSNFKNFDEREIDWNELGQQLAMN